MADFNFCTQIEISTLAGTNANATIIADATKMGVFCLQAESFINNAIRINFTDLYAGLNADVKYILNEAASCLAAIKVINYDMSGYTSRIEAETMMDVLRDCAERCIGLLMDKNVTTFLKDA